MFQTFLSCVCISLFKVCLEGRDRALKTGFAKMSRAWSPLKLWRCASPASASPEQWTSEAQRSHPSLPRMAFMPGVAGAFPATAATRAPWPCRYPYGRGSPRARAADFAGGAAPSSFSCCAAVTSTGQVTVRFRTDQRFLTEARKSTSRLRSLFAPSAR